MSRIRILVCRVDDEHPEEMDALAHFDLPDVDVSALTPETALDDLEASTHEIGQAALRRVLEARWDEVDQQLTEQYRQSFPPREGPRRRPRSRHRGEPLGHLEAVAPGAVS